MSVVTRVNRKFLKITRPLLNEYKGGGDEVGILGKYLVKNLSSIFWVLSMCQHCGWPQRYNSEKD